MLVPLHTSTCAICVCVNQCLKGVNCDRGKGLGKRDLAGLTLKDARYALYHQVTLLLENMKTTKSIYQFQKVLSRVHPGAYYFSVSPYECFHLPHSVLRPSLCVTQYQHVDEFRV